MKIGSDRRSRIGGSAEEEPDPCTINADNPSSWGLRLFYCPYSAVIDFIVSPSFLSFYRKLSVAGTRKPARVSGLVSRFVLLTCVPMLLNSLPLMVGSADGCSLRYLGSIDKMDVNKRQKHLNSLDREDVQNRNKGDDKRYAQQKREFHIVDGIEKEPKKLEKTNKAKARNNKKLLKEESVTPKSKRKQKNIGY
ncbi:uncharacterized protein [Henckelia pumila]|uniref:uncharacterized protein n=1 Tax=Henckelia pumila TaxID=405737 RepID=UPI003C6E72E5